MKSARTILVITIASWAWPGCHESSTSLVTDTGSSSDTVITDPGVDPTVPTCEDVTAWDVEATEDDSGPGTVTVQVDLLSAGVVSSCAGTPCLVVTVASGDGTSSAVTEIGPNRATFTYDDPSASAGDAAQLLLRWRVLCTDGGSDEERTVTSPIWICMGSGSTLSVSEPPCP
jgi:hypothetical protein